MINNLEQRKQLCDMLEYLKHVPIKGRALALRSAMKNIHKNMQRRIMDSIPEKNKTEYHLAQSQLFRGADVKNKNQLQNCLNIFVEQQMNAFDAKHKTHVFELITCAPGENQKMTKVVFDFENMKICEKYSEGEYGELVGFIVDDCGCLSEQGFKRDLFLRDAIDCESEQTFDALEKASELEIEIYNISEQAARELEQEEEEKDHEQQNNLMASMKKLDLLLNHGQMFGVKHVDMRREAIYLNCGRQFDKIKKDLYDPIKLSLEIQLSELVADKTFVNLKQSTTIFGRDNPKTLNDIFDDEICYDRFMSMNVDDMIDSINTVRPAGFTALEQRGQFSIPVVSFQDANTDEYFFALEYIYATKLARKHTRPETFYHAINKVSSNNKEHVKRIFIQSYPYQYIPDTKVFKIMYLVDESRMNQIFMPDDLALFKNRLGRAIRDSVKEKSKTTTISFNDSCIFKNSRQLHRKEKDSEYEKYTENKKVYDIWLESQVDLPSIQEQIKQLKCFYGVPVFYIVFIKGVKLNDLQQSKLKEHMIQYQDGVLIYAKCGFSLNVAGRLENYLDYYELQPQIIRFFFCHDINIERNFHNHKLSIGGESLDKMNFTQTQLCEIYDRIGYIDLSNRVADTEMYLVDDKAKSRLEMFAKFIDGLDANGVQNRMEKILKRSKSGQLVQCEKRDNLIDELNDVSQRLKNDDLDSGASTMLIERMRKLIECLDSCKSITSSTQY